MAFFDYPFVWMQYLLPQHGLSKLCGRFARSEKKLKNTLIKKFVQHYQVDLSEAIYETPEQYKTFNEFFTRQLKPDARPIANEAAAIVSPADGVVSQFGVINDNRIIQAKQHDFTLEALLGGNDHAASFYGGDFMTIYLSPRDYHRVHMPFAGVLKKMLYIPGNLFSVNSATTNLVPGLFSRNERVIAFFETEFGNMAVILIGAMVVGQIVMTWQGAINHMNTSFSMMDYQSHQPPIAFTKAEEIGYFQLGSTVIVCFEANKIQWCEKMAKQQFVKMGERVALIKNKVD